MEQLPSPAPALASFTRAGGGAETMEDGHSEAQWSAVQVAVRVRPLSANERAQGSAHCLSVVGPRRVVVGGLDGRQYEFNAAFPPAVAQSVVYDSLVAPLIDRVFDGYNATVFAYGQTGSGKTYTMGNEFKQGIVLADQGIIPRAMQEVFTRVRNAPKDRKYILKLSYLEILNEEIHDLLATSPASAVLSVRDDGKRGICVHGLGEHNVDSLDQAAEMLRTGALHRTTAATNMNTHSSRSHAVCTLTMEQYGTSMAQGADSRFAKLHLVDLAGSERAKRTNAEGARFREGVNINRGLLSLGNVINALSERSMHVPYRDSKLTRLLQDSLGGNSKTLMIACVSLADVNFEETCNTLRYASRALKIENKAVINHAVSAEDQVRYLKQQLEIARLQILQQSTNSPGIASRGASDADARGLKKEIERWRSIARAREEELQLVMTAKNKWKNIADELLQKSRLMSGGTGCDEDPSSRKIAMVQDAIDFDESVCVEVSPISPCSKRTQLSPTTETSTAITSVDAEDWSSDLDGLEEVIKEKERMIAAFSQVNPGAQKSTMHGGSGPLTTLSLGYEKKIRRLDSVVGKLMAERDRFAKELLTNDSDLTQEKLQARLQLAQAQLKIARHAETECKRLTRLWKSGSLKISTLEREIVDMKKKKVSLQRKLKDETEAHRKETHDQNVKILQLRRQDQRKQYELLQLSSLHTKQKNVLKRKNEEVVAVNKRMRSLVESQQQVQDQRLLMKQRLQTSQHRAGTFQQSISSKSEIPTSSTVADVEVMDGITNLLGEAIHVQMTIEGARNAICLELASRKAMAMELAKLESCFTTPESELNYLKSALKQKNEDIRLLQQKLSSVEKNTSLPPGIFPAKSSLCHKVIKHLVDVAVESRMAALDVEICKRELQEAEAKYVEQSAQFEEARMPCERQIAQIGMNGDAASKREQNADQVAVHQTDTVEVRDELQQARKQAPCVKRVSAPAKRKAPTMKRSQRDSVDWAAILSTSDEDEEDDDDDDSDYVDEHISRHISKGIRHKAPQGLISPDRQHLDAPRKDTNSNVMDEIDQLLAAPSAIIGNVCCLCHGKCATKKCECRARDLMCGPACSCVTAKCLNRGVTLAARKVNVLSTSDQSNWLTKGNEHEGESFGSLKNKAKSSRPFAVAMDKENLTPTREITCRSTNMANEIGADNKTNKVAASGSTGYLSSSFQKTTSANVPTYTTHRDAAIARFF